MACIFILSSGGCIIMYFDTTPSPRTYCAQHNGTALRYTAPHRMTANEFISVGGDRHGIGPCSAVNDAVE